MKKRPVSAPPSVRRRHAARVRKVLPEIVRRVYAGGFPTVEWAAPMNVEKLPKGAKWASGSGKVPLLANGLLGMGVMRTLDRKNLPHRSVVGCKLYLVWKGSATVTVQNRDHRLRRGDFLFVPPLALQRVKQIGKGSVLLLFRSPDVGDTKLDKIDTKGNPFS